MSTNWPNSVQTFTNPSAGDSLNSPSHSAQHTTVNDTVEALQEHAGLVLVKTQTIGSGVSSVTVTNAFSSTFENYRVTVSGLTSYTTNAAWKITFAGAPSNSYYWHTGFISMAGTGGFTWVQSLATSDAEFGAVWSTSGDLIGVGNTSNSISINCQSSGDYCRLTFGQVNYTSIPSSFTLTSNTGTVTGGTIRVYGYNNG
jgi:hypothetical protein